MTQPSNVIGVPEKEPFSGSYNKEDVTLLLEPIQFDAVDVAEKERLLQSGELHYSEMISRESPPPSEYMEFYFSALQRHKFRLAAEVVSLAGTISKARPEGTIVVVSLARAGTPIGVLLQRALRRAQRDCEHYSVSIIRDRGIDYKALDDLRARFDDSQLIFVDGWTGKGTIQQELTRTIGHYNLERRARVSDDLAVLLDLSGNAQYRATSTDYLLPCGMLNSIVSGLVSRSILSREHLGDTYHGCLFYAEYQERDESRNFVDEIDRVMLDSIDSTTTPGPNAGLVDPALENPALENDPGVFAARRQFIERLLDRPYTDDWLKIKPGIGEATRALLRRVPETLFLRDPDAEDVQHLRTLADERDVAVEVLPDMPYEATTIIRSLGKRG